MNQLHNYTRPVIYQRHDIIIKNGNSISEVLFVVKGKLEIKYYQNGSTRLLSIRQVEGDYFSGEELVAWFENDPDSSGLPTSWTTIRVEEEIYAFAISYEDLQNVIQQYKRSTISSQQN